MNPYGFRNDYYKKNTIDENGNSITRIYSVDSDAPKATFVGREADVAYNPQLATLSNKKEDYETADEANPYSKNFNNKKYKFKKFLRGIAEDPNPSTWYGRMLHKGPLVGSALGAATGFGIGAVSDFVLDKINGEPRDSFLNLKLLGTLLGGGAMGALGYLRTRERPSDVIKEASIYKNPINYILESLQSANDISIVQKAKLISAVKSLDMNTATELANKVRGCLGIGVGALIARYLFGMKSLRGTMFGGLVGYIGSKLF